MTRFVEGSWYPFLAMASPICGDSVPVAEMNAILANLKHINIIVSVGPVYPWAVDAEFRIFTDSQVCADVLNGMVKPSPVDCNFNRIAFETIRDLLIVQLKTRVSVVWVPRDENQRADWIAS